MPTKEQSAKAAIKKNTLDFLYDLHTEGVPLEDNNIKLLRENGFFDEENPEQKDKFIRDTIQKTILNNPQFTGYKGVSDTDKNIDIIFGETPVTLQSEITTEEEYRKRVEETGSFIFSGLNINIKQEDWLPESITEHTKDFIEWIDSISSNGFQNRNQYRKLNIYCQQAYQWIAENDSLSNYLDPEERENYKDKEIERSSQNTLYFLNKYLKLKEAALTYGSRVYLATPAHEIIIYLIDCGYSIYIGKPRQIAATSTIGGIALAKTMFRRNHFIKFVTENDLKGQEIFEDKIKYPFSEVPTWMQDDAKHDSGKKFELGTKGKKGDRGGTNSKIDVVPPSRTAISGGSPQIALIDEAGNISILGSIITDARPTSFWMNPITKKRERKRQIVVWGTGGDMEKGGKAFERELMGAFKNWKERVFDQFIIPLFFDWTTIPGVTQELYDSEKKLAYSVEGIGSEQAQTSFRQIYPSCLEDMFLTSAKTLVSQEYIDNELKRINKAKAMFKPKYGYFEPVYGDVEQPEGSDIPFNIIGATFVPLEIGDPRISVTIFQEPKRGWRNRYYKGTDPIASDSGSSNMASGIWDKYYNTVSAIVNYRTNNYREVFLQTLLLGKYYDCENDYKGVHELLEANIGIAYREYVTTKGMFDTLVFNTELPEAFQTGSGNLVGVDNKGIRNKMIIDNLFELTQGFGHKIYIEIFFNQLKTFVSSTTAGGNQTWGPVDKKYYRDDVLFAVVYAYICAQCFPEEKPYKIEDDKKKSSQMESTLVYDKNYNLVRVWKRVK